jgi:hypothetical protein
MAWDGYYEYDATEIINAPRTEAYLVGAGKGWFRPIYDKHDFAAMLEQPNYTTPLTDGAPWVDPDLPESWEFFGFYPLDVSGVESSARVSSPVEFTTDGGTAGRLRHGTKAVVFNGLLLASSERGAEYGSKWLRRALLGRACDPDSLTTEHSLGADLTYFAAEPEVDADEVTEIILDGGGPAAGPHEFVGPDEYDVTQVVPIQSVLRHMKGVTVNNGPIITSRHKMTCGGAMWSAQFTAIVGNPYEFGVTKPILQGYLDPSTTNPWVPGVTPGTHSTAPEPFVEVECGEDTWEPLFDPLYPALVVPPAPPSVPLGQFNPPSTWNRWEVGIPTDLIPLWTEVVPVVTVHATDEVRNVRLRFYADPLGTADPSATPCDYVGDVVLSYIPPGGTMILDGTTKTVFVVTSLGHRRRADSLVFSTDGAPFEWPSLSCGYGHIMTIDIPTTETEPTIDLALVPRNR